MGGLFGVPPFFIGPGGADQYILVVTGLTDRIGLSVSTGGDLMRRKKMGHKKAKAKFRRGTKVHTKNLMPAPMRGGLRL